MIGTGKYDFPGIRKAGAAGLKALLASFSWGASVIASPFMPLVDVVLEWFAELLANRGLVILNIGYIYADGMIDQARFDNAMDDALAKVKAPGLSPEQKRAIDEEVKKAFRAIGRVAKPN